MPEAQSSSGAVRLDLFSNPDFSRDASRRKELLWIVVSALSVASWVPGIGWRLWLLRAFGARIGDHIVLKPRLRVKYPWKLKLGDHVWIGENVWIENFAQVDSGSHCCLSQNAYIGTGAHDWSDPRFSFKAIPVTVGDGCWIGAGANIAPGTIMGARAVVALGGVASGTLDNDTIYAGNPARPAEPRVLAPLPASAG